jgi:hypothetical protein
MLAQIEERRSKVRFPIFEMAHYWLRDSRRGSISGVGQTINFSSSGVLVRIQHQANLLQLMEMAVEWPILLDKHIRIKFVAEGRVVRVEEGCVAIEFERHEFRTCRAWRAS